MAANVEPIFTNVITTIIGQVSVANSNRDGTGTLAEILTVGANGGRIEKILVKATVTTTAGTVRLFLDDGSNVFLWKEIAIDALTATGSVPAFAAEFSLGAEGFSIMKAGVILKASTENAEVINVIVESGDF